MGKVYSRLMTSEIKNITNIACVVAADHLIVSSVSNWGGYALAGAVAVLAEVKSSNPEQYQHLTEGHPERDYAALTCDVPLTNFELALQKGMPSAEDEQAICKRMVDAGARDGISGQRALAVDGMPLEKSIEVLEKIKWVCLNSYL